MRFKFDARTALYLLLVFASCIALVLGAISWSRTANLLLPLPEWVPATTTLLSPVTLFTLLAVQIVLQRATSCIPSWWQTAFPIINQVHSVLTTTIATIALAYLFPDTILSCHLDQQWQSFFQSKDSQSIRTIQDRFQCCGLRSIHDRAWPFKDRNHGDNACELQLGYRQSCFTPWRQQQQRVSWMVFVAALAVLVVKVGFVNYFPSRATWMSSQGSSGNPDYQRISNATALEEDQENTMEASRTLLPQAHPGCPNEWDVD